MEKDRSLKLRLHGGRCGASRPSCPFVRQNMERIKGHTCHFFGTRKG